MAKVEQEAQDRWGNAQVGPFIRNHLLCFLEASSQPNKHAHKLATGFKLLFLYQRLKAEDDSYMPLNSQESQPGGQPYSQVSPTLSTRALLG